MVANAKFADLYDALLRGNYLLEPVQRVGQRVLSRCPLHDDCSGKGTGKPRPSLSLHPRWGLTCFACTDKKIPDFLEALTGNRNFPAGGAGERPRNVDPMPRRAAPPAAPAPNLGRPVAVYEYRDPNGRSVAFKARFEPPDGRKTFRWRLPTVENWGDLGGMREDELPLYRAERVNNTSATEPVLYVEGEKAVEACEKAGFLAVTHAGGASQREFGIALEVLRGRDVWLWPDNDPVGRQCMGRVGLLIRRIARSVREVSVPLPYKGDAWDFFHAGGTAEQVREGVRDRESVEWIRHDAITIHLPTEEGPRVHFNFTDLEYRGSLHFHCEVTVDGSPYEYGKQLDLGSQSSETQFRQSLQNLFPMNEKGAWTHLLGTAFTKLRRAYDELPRGLDLADVPDDGEDHHLIEGVLTRGEVAVWFGEEASAKTYAALSMMQAVASGQPWLGHATEQANCLYIDWEGTDRRARRRLTRLYQGLGYGEYVPYPILYWPARGTPISEQKRHLRTFIERYSIGFIVVDSAAAAAGGKPEEAESALSFFNALSVLGDGLTTLVLAHVTKAGDDKRPFGSTFWSIEPHGGTAFVRKGQETEQDTYTGIFPRKRSDGDIRQPIGLHFHFDGPDGAVTLEATDVRDRQGFEAEMSARERIYRLLCQQGTMKAAEIAEELELSEKTVNHELSRNTGEWFVIVSAGGRGRGNAAFWGAAVDEAKL